MMAFAAVLLGFSSATQDVVIDAYRIESAKSDLQALMSSTYIAGYRIGMIVAGAGALYLASYFGSEKGDIQLHRMDEHLRGNGRRDADWCCDHLYYP